MGDVLATLPEERFTFEGKEYVLTRTNFDSQAFFGRWVFDRARAAAMEMGGALAQQAVQAVVRDRAAGEYDWGSVTVATAAGNRAGFEHLIFLTLCQEQKDGSVTPELVRRMFADDARRQEIAEAYNRLYPPVPPVGQGKPAAQP